MIYAAICTRHEFVCVGQTGSSLASRFSKHRHDIKQRPDNSEIAEHFHKDHSDGDMKVMILQTGLSKSQEQREHFEDRWICRLQSLQSDSSSGKSQQIDEDVRERDVRELFKDQLNRDAKSSDVNGRRKITSDVKMNPDVFSFIS